MKKDNSLQSTPIVPGIVYQKLPQLLQECTEHFTDPRERDVVLFSCLTILSGMFPTVLGKYHTTYSYGNLFCFICAPAASLKSSMLYGRTLGDSVQERHLKTNEQAKANYEAALVQWKLNKKNSPGLPVPLRPKYPVLILPGNTTAAALYRRLDDSAGTAILAETEADTLSNAIGSDFGSFDDLLRKAFHHEPLSLTRITDNVMINIPKPRLSVLLSGTPEQVPRLISSAENGLFSRFCFYVYSKELQWNNPTPCDTCTDLSTFFAAKSIGVMRMKDEMDRQEHVFKLTNQQFNLLSKNFEAKVNDIRKFEGHAAASVVFRLGLISFRIAMILSVLRLIESQMARTGEINCTDDDLTTALKITDTLFHHSMLMYSMLPRNSNGDAKTRQFFNALPENSFTRNEADQIGISFNIKERTVNNYLNSYLQQGILEKPKFGIYQKVKS